MKLGEFFTEELHDLLPAENLPWAEVDYRVKFGPAAEGILDAAHESSAGMIVMGCVAWGPFKAQSRVSAAAPPSGWFPRPTRPSSRSEARSSGRNERNRGAEHARAAGFAGAKRRL